jgi:hypothetical protein
MSESGHARRNGTLTTLAACPHASDSDQIGASQRTVDQVLPYAAQQIPLLFDQPVGGDKKSLRHP